MKNRRSRNGEGRRSCGQGVGRLGGGAPPEVLTVPSEGSALVASTLRRNNQCSTSTIYGPNHFLPIQESNSLFVGGQVAYSSSTSLGEDCGRQPNKAMEQSNGYGAPISLCCLCR
ncbi:hypothetical protein VNO78_33499 [Psophocarpus tetragonolobus]|uniref:Uncharacterized protein n=1 Tax=Psophocarpus tetragonolobus TaxID=3891 RepID=A0AAN9P457_PSOTE